MDSGFYGRGQLVKVVTFYTLKLWFAELTYLYLQFSF